MRLLAISDLYITAPFMQEGLAELEPLGVEIEVRPWEQPTLVALQKANLAIENEGPDAVPMPPELLEGVGDFAVAVVQFAPLGSRFIEAAKGLRPPPAKSASSIRRAATPAPSPNARWA